jgi:LysM repeat protein
MLWSGSGLWFLLAGIALIGAAALLFLNRRPQTLELDRSLLASDHARFPLILAGVGVIFLTMLLVPNFSGDSPSGSSDSSPSEVLDDTIPPSDTESEVVDEAPPINDEAEVVDEAPPVDDGDAPLDTSDLPEGYQVHVVASGDTLWGIAETYDTSVEQIVSANNLANPEALQLEQELIIPPGDASASADPSQ